MRITLLVVAFFLLQFRALCQQPYSYSINDDKGLPTNEVFDLLQDSLGFMWIGSNEGLFRYDGTYFKQYSPAIQSGKAISHLVKDAAGKLWCQNFSGKIFSVKNDSLKLEIDWSKYKSNFPLFRLTSNNNIWITADSGIYQIADGKHINRCNSVQLKAASRLAEVVDVFAFGDRIYFTSKTSIGYIQNGSIHFISYFNKPELKAELFISSSLHRVGNNLLLLARGEKYASLWLINNDTLMWQRNLPASIGRVFSLHNDGYGKLWIGGSNGAICIDESLADLYNGQFFFPGKSISKVLRDKEGNYWFATLQDGIFVVPSLDVWLYTQDNSPIADSRVKRLEKDNIGNLFIGYQNGSVSKYNIVKHTIETVKLPGTPSEIQSLLFDSVLQEVLISCGKTWRLNTHNMRPMQVIGISNNKAMAKEVGNRFLVANVVGGFVIKIGNGSTDIFSLRPKRATAVFCEPLTLRKWMCYADGLWMYPPDSTGFEVTLNGKSVIGTDIVQTSDGTVWVSTLSNGVLGFRDGVLQRTYNSEIGLVNGFARKLSANGRYLWIAATGVLIHLNTINNSYKTYNKFDGIPSFEIEDIECINGKTLLATPKGIIEIPDDFNAINKVPPSIFITSVSIHGHDTTLTSNYELSYNDNNLSIAFTGIAYRSQGEFKYIYRLLGLDSSWVTVLGSTNFARYPSLPAGKYTFQVLALNEDNIPSASPASLKITILKPYWQQWWFYVLCALMLIALVSTGFIIRIRQLRKRSDLEKRVVQSQLSALKAQMNPHFMFNALNSIQDLVLQQDTANAQLYLGKFAELTRMVLDVSGKEFVTLEKEIEMLSLYLELEKLRFGSNFKYKLLTDTDDTSIMLPSMLVQPFVENALKHGLLHKKGDKVLDVNFSLRNNLLVCTIDDNGIGREASAEIQKRKVSHKSFATKATTERLALLKDFYKLDVRLTITDKQHGGTLVSLELPITD